MTPTVPRKHKRPDPVPIQISSIRSDLKLLEGIAKIQGGALALCARYDDVLELRYEGPNEKSWMGLTWAAQRFLAIGDFTTFRTVQAYEDCVTFVHTSGVEVRIRFG